MKNFTKILQLLAGTADITPCLANCSNTGTCVLDISGNYICLCFQNYTGINCEKNIRPCSSSPCMNNGECLEKESSTGLYIFTCKCTPYFHGTYCESEYDLCANVTCNNGRCYKKAINETACRCFYMYEGEYCDQPSGKMKNIQTVISVSTITAIVIISCFYFLIILNDFLNLCLPKQYRMKKSKAKKARYLK